MVRQRQAVRILAMFFASRLLEEFTANRRRLVAQFDGLPWQHLMFFRRDRARQEKTHEGGEAARTALR